MEIQKLREILGFSFYAVLNTHSYSYCQNYLGKGFPIMCNRINLTFAIERQAHQKLTKEMISLVKKVLDVLSKKD